jgi:hypothetical protein
MSSQVHILFNSAISLFISSLVGILGMVIEGAVEDWFVCDSVISIGTGLLAQTDIFSMSQLSLNWHKREFLFGQTSPFCGTSVVFRPQL